MNKDNKFENTVGIESTFPKDMPVGDFSIFTPNNEDPDVIVGDDKVAVIKPSSNGTPVSVSTTISFGGVI